MIDSSANSSTTIDKIPNPVVIWDLPVRIVHWGFALLLPAMWLTAENGAMSLHRILGYIALGLLIFRLYWGVVGSSTARFANFVRGPSAILNYLRSGPKVIGHNPLGALSVVALLGLLALQITLGLFSQDSDALFSGPLSHLVGYDLSDSATELHSALFNLLVLFVALHLIAIAFYAFVRRDNLVRPMITGRKAIGSALAPTMASAGHALIGVAISAMLTIWVAFGLPPF